MKALLHKNFAHAFRCISQVLSELNRNRIKLAKTSLLNSIEPCSVDFLYRLYYLLLPFVGPLERASFVC
jgi:hypothetical protein